ncbi:MAG: SdrD B-like domain-containing protein [Methanolobus sp.]|nr:SdrD B-like domain-containing protein [Methanolobus sp.]
MIKTKSSSLSYLGRPALLLASAILILMALSIPASACHIGDKVWNDLNANGIQDAGEPGIKGVEVKLYKITSYGERYLQHAHTDSNGIYKFSVYNNRNYVVKFILPSGYTFSPQDQGTDDKLDSDADISTGKTAVVKIRNYKDNCTIDAGMYKKASVGNFIWEDLNNNGIQDEGEPGIEGVEVQLYSCTGAPMGSRYTDINGFYQFSGLMPSEYFLKFVLPAGYGFVPSDAGDDAEDSDAGVNGHTLCFTLESGECNQTIDAGLKRNTEEIPEFPTIALPMVAVIGLAFVFRRKNE